MPLYKLMRISKRKSTLTNLNDKMQSSEDIKHNHNLIECNFKYDINSFLASPSISFNKPEQFNLIVADDHGVDDDSDSDRITEKTNNNTSTVKYLNLAIPNCCPYDNDIVNVTTGGDQFINYSNNHNIKCNLNKINLFIISSTKIKINLNCLTLRDEQMPKIGWANDFLRIWPINFIGGAISVINSSKTETLLGGFSPSVEGLGVLLPPVHLHILNMLSTAPSHIGSSSRNILTLITLNKNQIPYLVKLIIYKNADENVFKIINDSNTNVTKILVINNNDNIMDVDDKFRDKIWIMAVDNLLVASNNYISAKIYLCIINGYDYHDYDNCKWQLLDRYYLMSVSRNSSVLLLFMQCVPEKQISINCYSLCYSYESLHVTEPINLVMIFNEMEILNLKLNKINNNNISYNNNNDDDYDDTFNDNNLMMMIMMMTKLISMQRKDKTFDNKKIFINNNLINNKLAATLTFIFNNNIDNSLIINAMNNNNNINSNIFGITKNTYNKYNLLQNIDDEHSRSTDDIIIIVMTTTNDVNINNLKGVTVPNKKIFKNIIKIQEINQSQCIHNKNKNNNSNIINVNAKNYQDNNIIKNFNIKFYFLKEFNQINYKVKVNNNNNNSVPDNNDINNNYKINIPAIINNIDLLQLLTEIMFNVKSSARNIGSTNNQLLPFSIDYISAIVNDEINGNNNIITMNNHQILLAFNRINDHVIDDDDDDEQQRFINEMWPLFMIYKQPICKSFTHTNYKPNTISITTITTTTTTSTTKTTTTTTKIMITQSDMNKSEYAFKKTLNSFKSILMNKDSVIIDSDLANQRIMMHNGRTTNKQQLHEKPDNDLLNYNKHKLQQSMIIDHTDESDDNNNDKYKNLQKLYKQSGIVFDHNFIGKMNFNKANATNNLKNNNLIKQVISDNKNLNKCDIDEKNDYFNDAKSDEYENVMKIKYFDDNVNMTQLPLKPFLSSNNNYMSFDQLTEIVAREKQIVNNYYQNMVTIDANTTLATNERWRIPRMMRLRGGVEQALNNGTTGWGSPPSGSGTSNTSAGSWGPTANAQQQPGQQWGATSQQQGNTSQHQQQPRQPDPNSNNKNPSQQPGAPVQQQNAQMNPNQQPNTAVNATQGNGNNWNTQGQQQPGQQSQQAGVVQQQPPNNNSGSLNPIPGGNNNNSNLGQVAGVVGGGTSTAAAKNQLEQLNTMREALFSQDGWGCQHVNQDSNWDVPGTPEPGMKVDPAAPPVWKPNINNGTELWEANLRNGGQPPPNPVQKTPWGHTPSSNLGGTWGEDDDGSEAGNVWTGAPANPPAQQWGQPATGMWPAAQPVGAATGPKKEGDWSGNAASGGNGGNGGNVNTAGVVSSGGNGAGNNWGDPREMRTSSNPMDLRVDPRDLRAPGGADPRAEACQRDMRMVDPRCDQMRGDMRGDPRGISGRLNGTSEMWGQHHNLTHGSQIPLNKMGVGPAVPPGGGSATGQWGGTSQVTGPKDLSVMNKPSGWEEPSPPAQRRSMPNFDDGTSLWGQQQPQQSQQPPSQQQPRGPANPHWKDMSDPLGRNMIRNEIRNAVGQSGPGVLNASTPLPQSRIGPSGPIKSDAPMWAHTGGAGRVNSWDEGHSTNWEDKGAGGMGGVGSTGTWGDSLPAASWPNKNKQIGAGGQGWQDSEANEWNHAGMPMPKPQQNKGNGTLELLRNSRQYQGLVNMGLKKEDIDLALRATNFNIEDAMEYLKHGVGMDVWRRHDDHASNAFDHPGFPPKYQTGPTPSMPFPNNNPNLINNIANAGGNPTLSNVGNMQPIQAQKYLGQGGHNAGNGSNGNTGGVQGVSAFNQGGGGNQSTGQPSTQQLRMLVQQIQMAVQAGYLNHQILNQPLAPSTLILLNQLLSNIKQLQMTTTNMNRGGVNAIQMTLTIAKLKLQISTLQNQIAAQQAIYVKQQQAAQHGGMGNAGGSASSTSNDYLRGVQHNDPINTLQGTFSEMSMNKLQDQGFQTPTTPQSRLNQWKLPTLDSLKDSSEVTDFSRAPGTTAKSTMSTSNSTIGSLGLQGDGTWSTGRNLNDGWPDSAQEQEKQDWPPSQPSPATAFTDLVPEFEPGKPWKGSQIKTIEDDPSITPGSVARSPLSIAAKDDLFAPSSKTSPTDLPPLSLSSSTWSFNPSGSQPNFTSAISKLGSKSNSWSDGVPQATPTTSELWGAPMSKSARGPPPGLGTNKVGGNGSGAGTNGWIGSGLTGRISGSSNWTVNNNAGWNSTWLLLKNLTAQIDGSTLRTLCMQHGPLQHFHLYLNHGIALCKYSSREEANKAQMALNNCVLGNTTICAESPSEGEVQSILQHLGVPGASQSQSGATSGSSGSGSSSGGQSAWRPPTQATPSRSVDTWGSGSVWPSSNTTGGSGNLWTPLDGGTERGTPSSLNSFLPESLLGSELN